MADFSNLPEQIRAQIWDTNAKTLAGWRRQGLLSLRILWAVIRDINNGQLNLRAMSLVYTTILSLVPLLAISFSVLKGFGVHEELYAAMSQMLEALGEQGEEIGERIFGFVENVKVGVLGSVGLALLIYTVISLMQKIEGAFNHIWHVKRTRPLARRFSDYLSVILIGPVLIFASIGIKASLLNHSLVKSLQAVEPFGTLIHALGTLLPFALVIGAFTFIYVFMPNTRIKSSSAFVGAVAASLLWNTVSWAFASFVVSSAQYTAIYSAFAALILFMLWLYFAWLVLLIGASIAFYHQNPDQLLTSGGDTSLSPRFIEQLGLAAMVEICARFQKGEPPIAADELAEILNVEQARTDEIVVLLRENGFLELTDSEPPGILPARPLEALMISDILAAVRRDGESARHRHAREAFRTGLLDIVEKSKKARDTALAGLTIADLLSAGKNGKSESPEIAAE